MLYKNSGKLDFYFHELNVYTSAAEQRDHVIESLVQWKMFIRQLNHH